MRRAGRSDAGQGRCRERHPDRIGLCGLTLFAGVAVTVLPASAQTMCSVFDNRPCAPTFCSVFDDGPCMPDIQYPFGQDLRLTVQTRRPETRPLRPPDRPLNTLQELFSALETCWQPPPLDQARPGTEITIRFSLNRSGEVLGEPRFTYSTPSLPAEIKSAYQRSIAEMLKRCTPLFLSEGLAGAIAGRPISGRFIDDRSQRRTENAR
jgi:hypothetical protein